MIKLETTERGWVKNCPMLKPDMPSLVLTCKESCPYYSKEKQQCQYDERPMSPVEIEVKSKGEGFTELGDAVEVTVKESEEYRNDIDEQVNEEITRAEEFEQFPELDSEDGDADEDDRGAEI